MTGPTPVGIGVGGEAAHLGGLAGLSSSDDEGVDGHLGLGELAQLTVNNEAEVSYDASFNSVFICSLLNISKKRLLFSFRYR